MLIDRKSLVLVIPFLFSVANSTSAMETPTKKVRIENKNDDPNNLTMQFKRKALTASMTKCGPFVEYPYPGSREVFTEPVEIAFTSLKDDSTNHR